MQCPHCNGPIEDKNCVNCGVLKYPTGILELDYEWAKMLEAENEKHLEFTYSSSDVFPSTSGNYVWVVNPSVTFSWNASS